MQNAIKRTEEHSVFFGIPIKYLYQKTKQDNGIKLFYVNRKLVFMDIER